MTLNHRLVFASLTPILLSGYAAAQSKATPVSPASPNQQVTFNVFLPLQNTSTLDALISSQGTQGSSNYRQWLTPAAFRSQFGASPAAISTISAALAPYGLTVVSTNTHGLTVTGRVSAIQAAFGAALWNAVDSRGSQKIVSTTALKLPSALAQAGAQVFSFSPVARQHTHSRRLGAVPASRYSPYGPYWFDDLRQAYSFPSDLVLTGAGRKIGIVMANDFLDSDMALYFGHEGAAPPTIVRVPIDGGAPFDPALSFETSIDIQQAGGMAPGATIYFYNVPDLSDASVLDAYLDIVETNAVDIVSSSFGGAEGFYTPAYNGGVDYSAIPQYYNEIFKQGVAEGITFVASSGDSGGLGLPSAGYFTATPQNPPVVTAQFLPGIEIPASSPYVVAVGGTNLETTYNPPSLASNYVAENADADPLLPYDPYGVGNLVSGGYWGSGGGASIYFSKPLYQYLVNTGSNMRTIPDISMQMGGCPSGVLSGTCPSDRSYSIVALDGLYYGVIGTSLAAPDFAGLLALAEQNLGMRLGNANYLIYGESALQNIGIPIDAFHKNIPGFNGFYNSTPGSYNMVVGNGTPVAKNLILAPFAPAAGNPQTPSNK